MNKLKATLLTVAAPSTPSSSVQFVRCPMVLRTWTELLGARNKGLSRQKELMCP